MKKSMSMMTSVIISFVIGLIILFSYTDIWAGVLKPVRTSRDAISLKAALENCLMEADEYGGLSYDSCNNGKYAAHCDPCLGAADTEYKDNDGDGVVDKCEKYPDDPKKKECIYYGPYKGQCCTELNPCKNEELKLMKPCSGTPPK